MLMNITIMRKQGKSCKMEKKLVIGFEVCFHFVIIKMKVSIQKSLLLEKNLIYFIFFLIQKFGANE